MIWASKYNGDNVLEILSNAAWVSHPFALTTYAHHILWTDWQTRVIGIADKWPGSKASVVEITFGKPFDLSIYHESRQPVTTTNSSRGEALFVYLWYSGAVWLKRRYGCGRSVVRSPGQSNQTQCCQLLAAAATFLRSCVAQALSHGDGPRHSLHASV